MNNVKLVILHTGSTCLCLQADFTHGWLSIARKAIVKFAAACFAKLISIAWNEEFMSARKIPPPCKRHVSIRLQLLNSQGLRQKQQDEMVSLVIPPSPHFLRFWASDSWTRRRHGAACLQMDIFHASPSSCPAAPCLPPLDGIASDCMWIKG